jgi:hypothetical protein
MSDESQAQTPAPEGSQPDAAQTDAATPQPDEQPTVESAEEQAPEAQPQAGGDVSTTPATAPVPLPGVPAAPVNAEANVGDIPGARMEPGRIGEALRSPEA